MTTIETTNVNLNPELFENDVLKSTVRERLLEITDEFLSQIDEALHFDVLDVRIVGSNAAYNYTPFSDLDLHLVVNLSDICQEHPEIVQCLFNSEKARFNLNYDISVKGIQVEIYVEDVRSSCHSNGIYSVLRDQWIKVPTPSGSLDVSDLNDEDGSAQEYIDEWILKVKKALLCTSFDIKDMINQLYLCRKDSLESQGEQGLGNLMFKHIRNLGLLDDLKSKYYEVRSDELSLEGIVIKDN